MADEQENNLSPEDAKLLFTAMLEAQMDGDAAAVSALSNLADDPAKLRAIFTKADQSKGAKMLRLGARRDDSGADAAAAIFSAASNRGTSG